MSGQLEGRKVAILVADGFEQVELTEPRRTLMDEGAEVLIVAPDAGSVQGFHHFDRGDEFVVDLNLKAADPRQFDALVLPGGTWSPDTLRAQEVVWDFVRGFDNLGKPIAAICHGPWILIDSGLADGRMLTSYPNIRADLTHAGAMWVDEPCVVSNNLITSRSPADLPQFCRQLIEAISTADVA